MYSAIHPLPIEDRRFLAHDVLNKENKIYLMTDDPEYLKYISERPKSHGLFGNVDINLSSLEKEVTQLSKEGRNIYRGIVSLSQKDAEALGYTDKQNWDIYMKRVMPDIAMTLGINPIDFTWVAAFHAEETHPHVHYLAWSNKHEIKSPFIHVSKQHKCREILSKAMFDENYESTIKDIMHEEREELNRVRNSNRNLITDETKKIMKEIDDAFSNVPGVTMKAINGHITKEQLIEISNKAKNIIENLPGQGSFKYQYLPPKCKAEVNELSNYLLENRMDMKKAMNTYLNAVEEGNKNVGKTKFQINILKEDAKKDIINRINNIILKEIKNVSFKVNEEFNEDALNNTKKNVYAKNDLKTKEIFMDSRVDTYTTEEDIEDIDAEEDKQRENESDKKVYLKWSTNYKNACKILYNYNNPKIAFEEMKKEAEKGNVLAMEDLGKIIFRYNQKLSVPYEDAEAESKKWYNYALDGYKSLLGSRQTAYINYRIGKFYEWGTGVEKDIKLAVTYYEQAVNASNSSAEYALGKIYKNDKLETGLIEENQKKAFKLFKMSEIHAKKDNPFLFYELGYMYHYGKGTQSNATQARIYYGKALDGFEIIIHDKEKPASDDIYYRTGKMYRDGLGTDINIDKAVEYFKISAGLNNENAKMALAEIYVTRGCIDEAIEIYEKLNKNSLAKYKLGKLYSNSTLGCYNLNKAIYFLTQSANDENKYAKYTLGKLYSNQELECFNPRLALRYLTQIAYGNEYAQYTLGKLYMNKELECYDPDKGIFYLTKSAEIGNQYAQFLLGKAYLWGQGVAKNENLGRFWLSESIKQGNLMAANMLSTYDTMPNVAYGIVNNAFNGILQAKHEEEERFSILSSKRAISKKAAIERRRERQAESNIKIEGQ